MSTEKGTGTVWFLSHYILLHPVTDVIMLAICCLQTTAIGSSYTSRLKCSLNVNGRVCFLPIYLSPDERDLREMGWGTIASQRTLSNSHLLRTASIGRGMTFRARQFGLKSYASSWRPWAQSLIAATSIAYGFRPNTALPLRPRTHIQTLTRYKIFLFSSSCLQYALQS